MLKAVSAWDTSSEIPVMDSASALWTEVGPPPADPAPGRGAGEFVEERDSARVPGRRIEVRHAGRVADQLHTRDEVVPEFRQQLGEQPFRAGVDQVEGDVRSDRAAHLVR